MLKVSLREKNEPLGTEIVNNVETQSTVLSWGWNLKTQTEVFQTPTGTFQLHGLSAPCKQNVFWNIFSPQFPVLMLLLKLEGVYIQLLNWSLLSVTFLDWNQKANEPSAVSVSLSHSQEGRQTRVSSRSETLPQVSLLTFAFPDSRTGQVGRDTQASCFWEF